MERYFLFDLPKIQPLAKEFKNDSNFENHLFNVILFAIWQLSIKQTIDEKNMIRQIVYRYHNSNLPTWLKNIVGDIETDYKGGFISFKDSEDENKFQPDEDYMREIWHTIERSGELIKVQNWYKLGQAMATIGLDSINDFDFLCEQPSHFARKEKFERGKPLIKIEPRALRLFYSNDLNKIEVLMLFAISSIAGRNKYAATNKNFIRMRMIGANDKAEYNKLLKTKEVREFAKYISGRKRFDNHITKLRNKGFIKSYIVVYGSKYAQMYISLELEEKNLQSIINKKKEHINNTEGTPKKGTPKRSTEKVHIKESIIL